LPEFWRASKQELVYLSAALLVQDETSQADEWEFDLSNDG
jgi:hypothetical protein